jgi:hypothetical protein
MKTFDLTLATDRAVCIADFGESCSKTTIFKTVGGSGAFALAIAYGR